MSDETTEETTTETAPVEEAAPPTDSAAPPVEEAAPLTRADLEAAVQAAVSAALSAPQESAETAPGETVEEAAPAVDEAALRESIRREVLEEAAKSGVLTRKGLVETSGSVEPEKPLHEMSDDEFRAYQQKLSPVFFGHNQ